MQQLFITPPDDFCAKLQVVVCFIEHDNEILFVKRSQNVLLPGTWSAPGGKVDPGENFEQAVIREIREECGIDISNPIYVTTVYIRGLNGDYDFIMFRYNFLEKPEIKLDTFENDDYAWLQRAQVVALEQQNILIPKEMECIELIYGPHDFGANVLEPITATANIL